jgi:alkanesulfonate monooxygenase SsuD/methylene tetrahydromethanopterin reductase-like flavin-dependent oxidoreductase (luciferase family)
MAVLAEDAGLDSVWVGDHFLYRESSGGSVVESGPWEAWTQLAAIAAVTSRIAIAPLVAALPFHDPPMLAKLAWTVDEVSNARLVLALGAGWNETEFRALGLPFGDRVARFEEAFHIVRRLIAGEAVTHHGAHFDIDRCVLLPPSRRIEARLAPIPMMIGSTGPRMLSITLPYVSAWNAWFTEFHNLPAEVPALVERFTAACDRAGRDPADIEKSVALLLDFGSATPRNHSINPVTGSTDAMADALARVFDAGIDHVQLVLDPITEETIERAATIAALVRS